jgi:alkylation response protein AidB-like acyl-CoA dehydrogenase
MTAAQAAAREHVQVRHQFGRPLASMQAVAHNIARIAADVALSSAAFDAAVAEAEAGGPGWRAAAALITSARAAGSVARLSHQCLGAMGITREHPLHRATLRLWAWRDEFQPGAALERRLGAAAVQAGREAVWDWSVHAATELTTRTSPWY